MVLLTLEFPSLLFTISFSHWLILFLSRNFSPYSHFSFLFSLLLLFSKTLSLVLFFFLLFLSHIDLFSFFLSWSFYLYLTFLFLIFLALWFSKFLLYYIFLNLIPLLSFPYFLFLLCLSLTSLQLDNPHPHF